MNEPASSLESGLFFLSKGLMPNEHGMAFASSCGLLVPEFLLSFNIVDVA